MSKQDNHTGDQHTNIYQIRVKGHLNAQWTDWFDGLTITPETNGQTCLRGAIIDQAALYGLLKKIRNLGLTLVSVCPEPDTTNNI